MAQRNPMKKVYNFIHERSNQGDIDMIFGDFISGLDVVHRINDTWDLADIAVQAHLFPSRTKAKEGGWAGPVPTGLMQKDGRDGEMIFCWWPTKFDDPIVKDPVARKGFFESLTEKLFHRDITCLGPANSASQYANVPFCKTHNSKVEKPSSGAAGATSLRQVIPHNADGEGSVVTEKE